MFSSSVRVEIIEEAYASSAYLNGKYGAFTSEQQMARIDEF